MGKPIFTMIVGIAGSGKSTYAKKLSEEIGATIFSSDELRKEMFDNVGDREHNNEVFIELRKRIKECLKSGKNAIMDSTNLSSKRRRSFVQELNKIDCEKRCIIMATPYEQCLENNKNRDREIPEHEIEKMYRRFNTPYWFEGWDDISIEWWEESHDSKYIPLFMYDYAKYSQDNPHHTMTLAIHCYEVGRMLRSDNSITDRYWVSVLMNAGFLHDCGKPFTKAFVNSKGEKTDIAHYYSHEHVGAYDSLFFDCLVKPLDVSILIDLHMQPYHWERDNNEKLHNKYKRLWGETLYNYVMKLHEADKTAH